MHKKISIGPIYSIPCRTGAAYITTAWTKEKEWWLRHKQEYCWKCGRPIEYNNLTHRYRHVEVGLRKE